MAHQEPRFQDVETADVILRLLSSTEEPLTLHLHSRPLCRSDFFEARLSKRWNPDNTLPVELSLPGRKNLAACSRCIELMYAPPAVLHTFFTCVQDALDVLEVAAELLFHDCVSACFFFLENVQWSPEDEVAIRSALASLNVEIPADLAARLHVSSDCKPAELMQDRLRLMFSKLSVASRYSSSFFRLYIKTQLQENVHPSVHPVFAGVNEATLYEEWHRNLDLLSKASKSSEAFAITRALDWLLEMLLSLKIGVKAVNIFAQEHTAKLLVRFGISSNSIRVVYMLERIMKAFQRGELIISRPIRFALVKNWLTINLNTVDDQAEKGRLKNDLREGFCALTKTLPQVDQSEIFEVWFATCFDMLYRPWPDLQGVLELSCDKLRQAQQRQAKRQETSV